MIKKFQTFTLVASVVAAGLTAGLFAAFGYAVMPGLRGTDDRAFVDSMQRINVSIVNPLFMLIFMGGLLVTIAAVVLHWRGGGNRAALPWIIAGMALYLLMFIITSAVNVPLNDKLAAAGDPGRITDLAAVRDDFEDTWVIWNIIRAVANTAAFGVLIWALFLYGRTRGGEAPAARPATGTGVGAPNGYGYVPQQPAQPQPYQRPVERRHG